MSDEHPRSGASLDRVVANPSTTVTRVPLITLNNGVRMPQIGLGTWDVRGADGERLVLAAVEAGYRSFDTAPMYENEDVIGRAIRMSGVARDEFFITTKLWNTDQAYEDALTAFDRSAQRLGLDVIDLFLIHWPAPKRDRYLEAWRALQRLHADGRVRAIGVSNFTIAALTRVLDVSDVVPVVNQIELHPAFPQAELRAFHGAHGISTEAWRPLGGPGAPLLRDPLIRECAARYGRTPAQAVLRWHLQLGNIVIPKSATPTRLSENLEVFDWRISDEDMAALQTLDTGRRLGEDPEVMN